MAADNPEEPATHPPTASEPNGSEPHVDQTLEALREILFSRYRRQIADLEAQLAELELRTTDEDALIGMITPVLGDVVRRKVRDESGAHAAILRAASIASSAPGSAFARSGGECARASAVSRAQL